MAGLPRVLSIQSHVVSGYVGNKSATFPLQILGFDVDAINSVQFSNHTGYKVVKGQVINEKELRELMEGIKSNQLDHYSYLLTGYTVSESFLNEIANIVRHLKAKNPKLLYVCDPVMGDNGKMYVAKELLPIYRDTIIPLADIITPNQLELELLSGIKVQSVEDAWKAIDILHTKNIQTIIVSSTELGSEHHLLALASIKTDSQNEKMTIKMPKLPASFTGTGDLFAALTLAWSHKTSNQLKDTLEGVVSTIQAVLKRTLEKHQANAAGDLGNPIEMRLIESKVDIENPRIVVSAEKVS